MQFLMVLEWAHGTKFSCLSFYFDRFQTVLQDKTSREMQTSFNWSSIPRCYNCL